MCAVCPAPVLLMHSALCSLHSWKIWLHLVVAPWKTLEHGKLSLRNVMHLSYLRLQQSSCKSTFYFYSTVTVWVALVWQPCHGLGLSWPLLLWYWLGVGNYFQYCRMYKRCWLYCSLRVDGILSVLEFNIECWKNVQFKNCISLKITLPALEEEKWGNVDWVMWLL